MLLRAALLSKGNPFRRYSRKGVPARADYSEKELASFVEPHVKNGVWKGPFPEDYLAYTDFTADIAGSTLKGWKPSYAFGSLAAMFGGMFCLHSYYQSHPEIAEQRPYIRKQFPYNGLYLELGGDPSKLSELPAITEEVYDPYPYYGVNSIDHKGAHHDAHH